MYKTLRHLAVLALLTAVYPGSPVGATAPGEKIAALSQPSGGTSHHLLFEANFGGLNAADFLLSYRLDSRGTDESSRINRFHLETKGLARMILLWIIAEGRGTMTANGAYEPHNYRVNYANRFRTRTVDVVFDPTTGQATPEIKTLGASEEKDDENEGKVPPEMRRDVIDPISAVVEAIRRTRDHLEKDTPRTFVLAVYDGRRRFDVKGEVQDASTRDILGTTHKVRRLVLTPEAISGFKESHRELWSKYAFHIYLSDDGRYVPLQIDAVGPGPMINLVKECATLAACTPETANAPH